MDSKSPIVNYPTPPTTSHNLSSFSFNIKSNSGNYPFNYSPTINNCVPSNDNSNTADMSNYNNINMYNTTSIITNNTNSSFNSPNREPYNHGSNDYQASNHISNDTSNFSIASLSSYSNINYTNSSVQPLSPQEL
ncbi:hypothetical protein BCR36DRAFT_580850 [Piromyces finnis]|uniref:Uncharacterized protein n=1 Tax=Piromyces finnis TaxID=1754191 RepID=A0A1Y1VHM0_9FUNG|nr:hypothetical protein BCR36DRAFT_580850 [Piromyces finnis]|eukprot:ORX56541.1 hypothetical protein BCR36DRAFT_580850 [Piromyces finnis]